MNPWGFVIIGIGLLLVIIGVQGTQHGLAAAVTGHKSSNQNQSVTGSVA